MIYLLLIIAMILSLAGETFCKVASQSVGLKMYILMLGGGACWGFGGYLWTQIYKLKSITEIIVIYNPINLLLLSVIGY